MFNLLLVVILVALNGFFVAAEFALVKVRSSYLEQLENEGDKRAIVTKKVTSNLNVYLNACQFGITLASLGLGWVGEPAIATMIHPIVNSFGLSENVVHIISFIIAFSLITCAHIILGEIVPKTIAINKSDKVSLWSAKPLMFFYKITYPFVWLLNTLSNLTLRLIGMSPSSEHEVAHTEEELRILMSHSQKSGHINKMELELIEGAFDFADRIVRQVMIPRVDMVTLNFDDSYDDVMDKVKRELYTRYPVINGDKDNVIGYVHLKDLIVANNENFEMPIRTIVNLPESTETSEAMNLMKKNRVQIALIIDEYGGTAGMITMEDLLEEIVDEIRDEFDTEELLPIIEIENGYSVDSKVIIETINDLTGLEINSDEIDTIGGWLYQKTNGEVKEGFSFQEKEFLFIVQKVLDNHIARIKIAKV